jgi:AbiJ-like protein
MTAPPFSARNRGVHRQIDNAFPPTARNGLLHLLLNLVEKDYVSNWSALARELQRIARLSPTEYDNSKTNGIRQARADTEEALTGLNWDKIYDFCERLHSHLARDVGYTWNDEFQMTTPKAEVQTFVAEELQRLFEEEGLAFEFTEGLVRRRGRKHTVDVATRAQIVLGDPRLASARKHYDKALQFFRNHSKPDYENTVKEAVCSVEAAGKSLFPAAKAATLGDLAKWLASTKDISVPKALTQTITGIYAYRSGGDGVGHGGSEGGAATTEVAEYVLAAVLPKSFT